MYWKSWDQRSNVVLLTACFGGILVAAGSVVVGRGNYIFGGITIILSALFFSVSISSERIPIKRDFSEVEKDCEEMKDFVRVEEMRKDVE